MTFLHPAIFAAGVACIAIPILIHLLLRQRRKPIQWAAMRFLLEAYRKQRRKLRLQQLLLLAARCLVIALLAAAVARPLLESAGLLGATGKTLYLVIDNGLASQTRLNIAAPAGAVGAPASRSAENEPALARHQRQARALLAALGPGDKAALITLGAPAQALVLPASADIAAVRTLVDDLKPTDSATDLAAGLDLLGARLKAEREGTATSSGSSPVVALLSDFLEGSADTGRPLPASLASLGAVRIIASTPVAAGAPNVQITSVEPLRPVVLTGGASGDGGAAQREQVRVTLRRTGPAVGETAVSSVRLRVLSAAPGAAPSPPAQGVVRWEPGQSEATVALQIDPASARDTENPGAAGSVLIAEIDRDALPGDNTFRRPVGIRESLRVGIIAQRQFASAPSIDRMPPDQWLRLALRPSPSTPIDVIDLDPAAIDGALLAGLDAVFAPAPDLIRDDDWPRLRKFTDAGGLLVISPPQDATVHLWTDVMSRELGLGWRLAREPRNEGAANPGEPAAGGASGGAIDESSVSSSLLALITPELGALARPVRVMRALPPEETTPATEVLIRLAGGEPWLIAAEPGSALAEGESESRAATPTPPGGAQRAAGRGLVIYLASAPALSWTDLPAKPLMVPLVQEIARQGFGRAAGSWSGAAGRPVPVPARTVRLRVLSDGSPSEEAATPPAISAAASIAAPSRRAALFEAIDDAGRARGVVAVNADTDAGRTSAPDASAIRAWLAGALGAATRPDADPDAPPGAPDTSVAFLDEADPAAILGRERTDSPLSFPLLIAALAIAVAELLMARWFSYAGLDTTSAPGIAPAAVVAASAAQQEAAA